jgi:hypothetical protein
MNFRLVDSGWDKILDDALATDKSRVRIICPFIKEKAAKRLLRHGRPAQLEVITRYDLNCFRDGVSDVAALKLLFQAGAKIRGVKNLHAKAYLIGASRAIITSANLTEQGLTRNHEFGFSANETAIAANCHTYFDGLWKVAGRDVTLKKLEEWDHKVTAAWVSGAGTKVTPSLGDEGRDVGLPAEQELATTSLAASSGQGFVKFFGTASNRFEHTHPVFDEVDRSGCYFACNYPANKRPRGVRDGAVLFTARLVKNPTDILIFGKGIGMAYVDGRDDATAADLTKREWKADWPRYIRVHDVKFVRGTLANGVSLNELMGELEGNAFAATKRNALSKKGNTNPRRAFNQQAAVELTPEAISWLDERLERSFDTYGQISKAELATLDWPTIKL